MSFMLALVTLSLHRKLSFFVELFQHIVYGWIVMLLYAQRYFLYNNIMHIVVYINRVYTGGMASNTTQLHL